MALTLSTTNPDQSALTRPYSPYDVNGIAHAIDSTDTGNGDATQASREATKLAYATWLASWRANFNGNTSYTELFPIVGSGITYANDP